MEFFKQASYQKLEDLCFDVSKFDNELRSNDYTNLYMHGKNFFVKKEGGIIIVGITRRKVTKLFYAHQITTVKESVVYEDQEEIFDYFRTLKHSKSQAEVKFHEDGTIKVEYKHKKFISDKMILEFITEKLEA